MPSPTAACLRCHTAMPAGNDANSCPRCLFGLAATPSGSGRAGAKAPSIAELQPLFPDYELEALLGRGGMGAVYRARQVRLGRHVAIKVLLPELVADPAFAGRFEREAKALARLTHPGIVGVHDFGKAGDYYFLVLEHVDGANLRDLLAQGRMTTRDVLQLVPQLCDALQYAHDHRVVHRDIKPANVLVDGDGRVRIADFGLAKLLGDDPAGLGLTQTEQAMGTPHYMAPEQMRNGHDVDHRADLYSLGVVIYEMLTGQLPIGRFQPPSARDAAARGFDPVVMKSLENDPAQRYQAAAEVKRDLDRAAGAPTRGASATAATGRALPWMTWLYVAAIAVGCMLPWYWVSDSVPMIWPSDINPSADTATIRAEVERLGIEGRRLAEPWVRTSFPMKLATGFHGSAFGFPLWITLVAAGFGSLFAMLRAKRLAVPVAAEGVCVAVGAALTIATLGAGAASRQIELGSGVHVAAGVFLFWLAQMFVPTRGSILRKGLVLAGALLGLTAALVGFMTALRFLA